MRQTLLLLIFLLSWNMIYSQTQTSKIAFNNALKHYRIQEYQAAIPYLEEAVESSPDFIEGFRLMAHCYDEMDDIDEAIKNFKIVLSIDPNLKKPLYNLGLLYISKKAYEEAKISLQKAVNISPDYEAAKVKLKQLNSFLSEGTSDNITKEENIIITKPEHFTPPSYDETLEDNKTTEIPLIEEEIEIEDDSKTKKKSKKKRKKKKKKKKKDRLENE